MTDTGTVAAIVIAGMPALPGLVARQFRDAADYARLSEVIAAANQHDGISWAPSAANLQVDMDGDDPDITPTQDVVIVEIDGRAVAEAQVWRVVRDGRPMYEISGHVVPDARGQGIGAALLHENLRRVAERGAADAGRDPIVVRVHVDDVETAHRSMLARSGFQTVRHFFLMRHPKLASLPDAPLPEGLEVRPVTADQHRAIFEAEQEAFADHWSHREWTEDDFRATYAQDELDTGLWVVAWDGDQVAGVVQTWIWASENATLGVRRGWLEHISVRRAWRRRGLARAITALALGRLRDAGMDDAMLGVDSENVTGALGLYEGLGFEVFTRASAVQLELPR